MNTKQYIDQLFTNYEETPQLQDFKEELNGHVTDRMEQLKAEGCTEQEAFAKATKEMGDMSKVADEVSLQKKQEVLSDMYMKTRNFMSTKRSAMYALCGLLLGFAILFPLLTWFATDVFVGTIASAMPFAMVGILGLVFLGLTQETAAHEAMNVKRALWYVLATALVLFGIMAALLTYYGMEFVTNADLAIQQAENTSMIGAISILIVFCLSGIALGIFLGLTERDRRKPWVVHMHHASVERFGTQAQMERYGIFSGVLWIAAIAMFALLTILYGFTFSWLAIVVGLIVQMLLLAIFTNRK